jgi:energy-converting hydrogenase Eha subunit E
MTSSTNEPTDRTAAFAAAVSERKLKADSATSDKVARGLGVALMVVGFVGTFLAYNNSRSLDDGRDIASNQILALVFLAVVVVGTGLYVAGALARVLRLWLLRQLVESQDRMDQLTEALRDR